MDVSRRVGDLLFEQNGIGDTGARGEGLTAEAETKIAVEVGCVGRPGEWSRWEQSGTERLAVFRFAVPMDRSTYEVKFCCVPVGGTFLRALDRVSAYDGELAVHPVDGTIAHITLIADLDEGDLYTMLQESTEGSPLQTADLAVEYGLAEIGGKIYICPMKAVALSRARTVLTNKKNLITHLGPVRTYLDHLSFTGYHVFRSESRIITDVAE